jgi:type IV pilus assembly protein PilA
MDPDQKRPDMVFWTLLAIAAVLGLVGVAVVVVLVVLPNFKTNHHPKWSEARSNLKGVYTSERGYLQEKDVYSDTFTELGVEPERGNRYAYFIADDGETDPRSTAARFVPDGGVVVIASDAYKYSMTIRGPFSRTGCPLTLTRSDDGIPLKLGRVHLGNQDEVVVAAAGNIDADPTLDCWSISTANRVADGGEFVPAGVPFHEQDDTTK